MPFLTASLLCGAVLLLLLYVKHNDRKLLTLPTNASFFSPKRISPQAVHVTAAKHHNEAPISINDQIPPKTGRRYIVVGGGGFLGGWIVSQLLGRGEDPLKIRILDICKPSRKDFSMGPASKVEFFKVDIFDRDAVEAAFKAPWPDSPGDTSETELTVFHTAASIRFYERHADLLHRSAKVNVHGTQNVINSARGVGASILVYTSSGSICIRRSRFWLWPWEREPPFFVQVIDDVNESLFPNRHQEFFSNYAVTKKQAEEIVRAADDKSSGRGSGVVLRTGCLRPGNGIFGPGDMLCHAYLRRPSNPTWISNILQSFIYVENCACAHLCYEQRLIQLSNPSCNNPDIGGQAFTIADPGPPATYGDIHEMLTTLTDGETHFQQMSPTAMLFLAHIIELIYLAYELLGESFPFVRKIVPRLTGDIISLQPSLYALTQVHLIFDDSRARLPPEKGGLGYQGAWTTIEGMHKTYNEHTKGFNNDHNSGSGGISLGFRFKKKVQKGNLAVVDASMNVPMEVQAAK